MRKDIASSSGVSSTVKPEVNSGDETSEKKDEEEFSSKAQIMTLMTTDVDRVSEFSWHLFALIGKPLSCFRLWPSPDIFTDSPIEIVIGTMFLYQLLGMTSLLNSLCDKLIAC